MGQSLVYMPECHSTNAEALKLLQNNPQVTEGTLVITDNQTAGRGQRGNTWESDAGKNLTFSLVLKPTFLSAKDQFRLNMAVSLGLFDYLTSQLTDVKIKWPNDMMLGNQKTCGMLIENQLSGQQIQHSIVGIGLNVNQEHFPLPTPTSMFNKKGHAFDLNDALAELMQWIEGRYLQLRATIDLKEDYVNALYGRGEKRSFKSGEEVFEGMITGIDPVGLLEVEVSGRRRYFDLKQIQFLK
jgi:BirA family transcriptional regulator, biotin operon repressor / biotin---[acetyl-CoA-carboxylase] ligase